jgi:hypothetical protein
MVVFTVFIIDLWDIYTQCHIKYSLCFPGNWVSMYLSWMFIS